MRWVPRYTEEQVRGAVESSPSLTAALRALGLRPAGANFRSLRKLIAHYGVSTDHMNPNWVLRGSRPNRATPLADLLVEGSLYKGDKLKHRLYDAGLKARQCELCEQGERPRDGVDPRPHQRRAQ